MMDPGDKIVGGIYLVVDPSMDRAALLTKLSAALKAGVHVVQIWNNWCSAVDKLDLIESVGRLCRQYDTALLINEDWQLLDQSEWLQGVHFDAIPADYEIIKRSISRPFLSGITCSGNLDVVGWADNNSFDYVSFCSMFPSPSAGSCDIVMPATVRQARTMSQLPFFVSGGITPENLLALKQEIAFEGIAVISGIMNANDPELKIEQYKIALGINS